MNNTFFDGHDEQSLGKIVQRATAVGAKMWCLSLFSFSVCHAPRPERCSLEGTYSSNKYCVTDYRSILMRFSPFFQKRLFFQMHYIFLIFVARWRHNFREIAVKNCDKSKNLRKSLCAPLQLQLHKRQKFEFTFISCRWHWQLIEIYLNLFVPFLRRL